MFLERWLLIVRMRVRSIVAGRRLDREIDDELGEHLERRIAQHVAAGMAPEAARTAALRAMGGLQQRREEMREARGFARLAGLWRDVQYAMRMLGRRPGFSAIAVLTLALGIGANTAIFAVVNGVLFQPLPFPEPDRLVLLSSAPVDPLFGRAFGLSEQRFLDFQNGHTLLEHTATFAVPRATLTGAGDPLAVTRAMVTTGLFDLLRVAPALGRAFSAGDDGEERSGIVVIGHDVWRDRFDASRSAIGRIVNIDGMPHEVIGVMPPGFSFPDAADVWTPLRVQVQPGNSWTRPVIGRLRKDVSLQQVRAELEALAPPPSGSAGAQWQIVVAPLNERAVGQIRRPLMVVFAGVAFVLLIACANVANLFLVRMAERERELTVRVALGAGRVRLLQQLVAESGVVAVLGAAGGVLLAAWALPALLALAPPGTIPRAELVRIDLSVLAFTACLAVVTTLAFGLIPAFRATRSSGTPMPSHRAHTRRHERLHTALVVAEVALSVVLLTGAGLMFKSFLRLSAVDTGFTTHDVVTATVDLPRTSFRTPADAQAFHGQVLERLRPLSGVSAAGLINWLPFGTMSLSGDLVLDGGRSLPADYQVDKPGVSAGYFDAMGIRVLKGRVFTSQDDANGQAVAVVSRSVAADLWPNEEPVGRRLSLRTPPKAPEDWLTVVGVVDDVRQQSLTEDRGRAIYQSYLQVQQAAFLTHMTYVVRTESSAPHVLPGIRAAMRSVDPTLPVPSLVPMSTLISARIATPAFQARLLSIFASIALALTVVGIYGVLAYSVSQRVREFGIRLALGAQATSVLGLVLVRTSVLAGAGIAIGAAGAVAVTRLLTQWLFEVTPTDPATFMGVALLLACAALAAAAIPAWRAARVDPAISLRAE